MNTLCVRHSVEDEVRIGFQCDCFQASIRDGNWLEAKITIFLPNCIYIELPAEWTYI